MTLYENDLTPAVYNALRESVGWTPHPADRLRPRHGTAAGRVVTDTKWQ